MMERGGWKCPQGGRSSGERVCDLHPDPGPAVCPAGVPGAPGTDDGKSVCRCLDQRELTALT